MQSLMHDKALVWLKWASYTLQDAWRHPFSILSDPPQDGGWLWLGVCMSPLEECEQMLMLKGGKKKDHANVLQRLME